MEVVKVVENFIRQYDELIDECESLSVNIDVCENLADTIFCNILDLQKAVINADTHKVKILIKVIKCLFDGLSFHIKDIKLARLN